MRSRAPLVGLISPLLLLTVGCGGSSSPAQSSLSIATTSLANGTVLFPYSQNIEAQDGVTPFTWSVSTGKLPHGISLNGSGDSATLSGMPDTVQATVAFTIQVADAKQNIAKQSYTIAINSTGSATLEEVQGVQVPGGNVEIEGLSAGTFNPHYWQNNTLNWVPDVRQPLFAAEQTGIYRNIYAPWPLEQSGGWRLFYGGWDGQDVPFDQIFSSTTPDFLTFGTRDHVISNGAFVNVNNVNVQRSSDGSLEMICTGGIEGDITGHQLYFSSLDGATWNGSAEPYAAQFSDMIPAIQGYSGYSSGNFNGANVLLRDNGTWVLYFADWNKGFNIYRATATTLPHFQFQDTALTTNHLINDIEKFVINGRSWYVGGLHQNEQALWYTISNDGVTFQREQTLFTQLSSSDYYIVAMSFVSKGNQLLGALLWGRRC